MNDWTFDWRSWWLGVVPTAILFVVGAFVRGFLSKAGEDTYDEVKKRVSPTPLALGQITPARLRKRRLALPPLRLDPARSRSETRTG